MKLRNNDFMRFMVLLLKLIEEFSVTQISETELVNLVINDVIACCSLYLSPIL